MYRLLQHYQKADSVTFYQQVVKGMRLSLRSDSLDHVPDKKGRVKPRWQEENAKRIVVLHPLLINAGIYLSRRQYPMMGANALKLYLTARQHPSLTDAEDEQGVAYYYLSTIYYQSRGYRQAD
ncbi:TPR domain protein, partial [gut metagenome]